MSIPALDRGLLILDFLINSDSAKKYTEIKNHLAGITDASLNRLLKSLLASGHVLKTGEGYYQYSDKIDQWRHKLEAKGDFITLVGGLVEKLSGQLRESAAFALYKDNFIEIIASRSCPDSVTIIKEKGILCFEADHAAALAIMDALGPAELGRALNSRHSKIASPAELRRGLKAYRKNWIYADVAAARPGISRMAVRVRRVNLLGALFLALPTARMNDGFTKFAQVLEHYRQVLEKP